MSKIDKWTIYTKIHVNPAPRNLTPRTLVTRCVFNSTGLLDDLCFDKDYAGGIQIEVRDADHINIKNCELTQSGGAGAIHFPAAYSSDDVPALVAKVEQLQRELHDEQVRRNKWERICEELGLVALEPAPDACLCYGSQALPCGHPREEAGND